MNVFVLFTAMLLTVDDNEPLSLQTLLEWHDVSYPPAPWREVEQSCSGYLENLKTNPETRKQLLSRRWECRAKLGDFTGAQLDAQELMGLDSLDARTKLKSLGTYLTMGETPDKLLRDLTDVLTTNPKLPMAHFLIGSIQLNNGRPVEAMQSFDHALAIDPTLVAAHAPRGMARYRTGHVRLALTDFEHYLLNAVHDPRKASDIHAHRSSCYSALNEFLEADVAAALAFHADPQNPFAIIVFWESHARRRHEATCLDLSKRMLLLDLKHDKRSLYEARNIRAFSLAWAGDPQNALKQLTGNNNETINNPRWQWLLPQILALQGKWREAAAAFDSQGVPIDSLMIECHAVFLSCCPDQRYRDGKRAISLLSKKEYVLAAKEKRPVTFIIRAMAEAEAGNLDLARQNIDRAYEESDKKFPEKDLFQSIGQRLKEGRPYRLPEAVTAGSRANNPLLLLVVATF